MEFIVWGSMAFGILMAAVLVAALIQNGAEVLRMRRWLKAKTTK